MQAKGRPAFESRSPYRSPRYFVETGSASTFSRSISKIVNLRSWCAMTPQFPRDHLLRTGTGRPYAARGFSAIWQRLMAKYVKSGGERFTFHDLRVKAASDMASV